MTDGVLSLMSRGNKFMRAGNNPAAGWLLSGGSGIPNVALVPPGSPGTSR